MLHCGSCDYFKVLSKHPGSDRIKASKCEYVKCMFYCDVELLEEYPCNMDTGGHFRLAIDKYCGITA